MAVLVLTAVFFDPNDTDGESATLSLVDGYLYITRDDGTHLKLGRSDVEDIYDFMVDNSEVRQLEFEL